MLIHPMCGGLGRFPELDTAWHCTSFPRQSMKRSAHPRGGAGGTFIGNALFGGIFNNEYQ